MSVISGRRAAALAPALLILAGCASASSGGTAAAPPPAAVTPAPATSATSATSAAPADESQCPPPPAGHDAAWQFSFNTACDDWAGQVQMQLGQGTGTPGQIADGWCRASDETGDTGDNTVGNDTTGQLRQACRQGIAAAGGPGVDTP